MDTSSDGGTDSLQKCDERPRIVRDELPAVTRGDFPSLDYVHCPVPGCKFSTGVLMKEVLNDYFTSPDGKQRPWHFEHATTAVSRDALFADRSKIMRRYDDETGKHVFLT